MAKASYIFCKKEQKMIPLEEYIPPEYDTPMIIKDRMNPIKSMADGKTYESKSAYYKSLKAQGYEIVGNEWNDPSKRERTVDKTTAEYKRYKEGIRESIFKTCHQMGIKL